jgi:hypothetical protein
MDLSDLAYDCPRAIAVVVERLLQTNPKTDIRTCCLVRISEIGAHAQAGGASHQSAEQKKLAASAMALERKST